MAHTVNPAAFRPAGKGGIRASAACPGCVSTLPQWQDGFGNQGCSSGTPRCG